MSQGSVGALSHLPSVADQVRHRRHQSIAFHPADGDLAAATNYLHPAWGAAAEGNQKFASAQQKRRGLELEKLECRPSLPLFAHDLSLDDFTNISSTYLLTVSL